MDVSFKIISEARMGKTTCIYVVSGCSTGLKGEDCPQLVHKHHQFALTDPSLQT